MSYNPIPPRVWSRVQNQCTYTDASGNSDINYNQVYIPLTKQTVTQAQANYEDKMIYKGNVLQYKGNSSRLTKSQKYTQLAKGFGPNRTKVFATQSQTYTNPNTTGLRRINTQTYPYPNGVVGEPNNPSGPFQYNVPNPNGCSNNSIQDGGTLVCGTFANPCTGDIIKQGATSSIIYNPASASDVPGSSVLFWDTQVQTWFPKPRYVMNNSTDKWPVNYKGLDGFSGLVSAVRPDAPVLTLVSESNTSVSLSWSDISNNNCISVFPITSYNIYQNGLLVQTQPYTIKSTTIGGLILGMSYSFFITSVSNRIESLPSNIINVNILPLYNAIGYSSIYSDPILGTGIVFENSLTTQSLTFNYPIYNINVLVVGGGGGGGLRNTLNLKPGGGGGGGGIYYSITFSPSVKTTYNMTVGNGGFGANSSNNPTTINGTSGTNSIISTSTGPLITSTGGGGANGSNGGVEGNSNGGNGGSGQNSGTGINGLDSVVPIIAGTSILLPFTSPSTTLNLSGGGGSGENSSYPERGGNPGLGVGGTQGGSTNEIGVSAAQSFVNNSGFGGGGGGCPLDQFPNIFAGNGGNGVIIFWFPNT